MQEGPRPLVPRRRRGRRSGLPGRADGQRALLFVLYTSGSTGKPKGIMHTTGGYLTARVHRQYVFDLHPETDVFWCTADVGWVTGHCYVVYGPLANGATSSCTRARPNFPDNAGSGRSSSGTRSRSSTPPRRDPRVHEVGPEQPGKHDLSSLRLLGTVGEPINPEAWMWYHTRHRRRPLPDRRHLVADRDGGDHDHARCRAPPRRSRVRRRSRCPGSRRRSSTTTQRWSPSAAAT